MSGEGYAPTATGRARRAGSGRRLCAGRWRSCCGRPFGDATSGLYAVNAKALPLLAETFQSRAPEVEALIRITDAGLRLEEVPVTMAERASGVSKLRGSKAVKLVLTVTATLIAARFLRKRRR